MLTITTIDTLFRYIDSLNTTLSEVILAVLCNPHFERHALTQDIIVHVPELLSALSRNSRMKPSLLTWAHDHMKQHYHESARHLT